MKKRLLFLAAFAAALVLFAGCEGDTVGEPSPTSDFPLCEGNKSDDPSCPVSLPGEDASSPDAEQGFEPDTAPPEPQVPAVDYEGVYCPDKGCVLIQTTFDLPDSWNRWDCGNPPDFPPDSMVTTGMKTEWVPDACGL